MTPADIAAIEARLLAATPGPWRYDPMRCYRPGANGAHPVTTDQEAVFSDTSDGAPTIALTGAADDPQSMRDADFIAHAPTDIAVLLAEVRRLTARVAELEEAARWRPASEKPPKRVEVLVWVWPGVRRLGMWLAAESGGWWVDDVEGNTRDDDDILGWRPLGPGPVAP